MVVNMLSCRLLLDNNTKFFCFVFCRTSSTERVGIGWWPVPHWAAQVCSDRRELWRHNGSAGGFHGSALVSGRNAQQVGYRAQWAYRQIAHPTWEDERIWTKLWVLSFENLLKLKLLHVMFMFFCVCDRPSLLDHLHYSLGWARAWLGAVWWVCMCNLGLT